MIQEIVTFIDHLNENASEVFTRNLRPKEGLYILLDLDEEGNLLNVNEEGNILEEDLGVLSKKELEMPLVMDRILPLWVNTIPVSNAKIFTPINKIFGNTCSPFAFSFNKKNWEKYLEKGELQKKIADVLITDDNIKEYFQEFIIKEIRTYFDNARQYVEEEHHRLKMEVFRDFLIKKVFIILESLLEYNGLSSSQGVYFFLKGLKTEDYKVPYEKYFSEKVFNKEIFNKLKKSTELVHGVSDSLSYFNEKKPYLKHFSAPLDLTYRVNGQVATYIWQFYNMIGNRQLPNPLPLFLDREELNGIAVKLYNEDEGITGYKDLIKRIIQNNQDLSNYYLIYFDYRSKKSKIIDIDFVPQFGFEPASVKIVEVFPLGGKQQSQSQVENIFDFERAIFNPIFNYQLILTGNWGRYFGDIEAKKMSSNTYNQLLRYRKSVYDYIYKSRRQAISGRMFYDIMSHAVLDDIRSNEDWDNTYRIKEKLNIWFSLFEYFDFIQHNKPLKNIPMVNRTQELLARVANIADSEDLHFSDDHEFAFSIGQLLYFLLSKNQSTSRSHALLEPFLQKTSAELLKLEIARCFDAYKYAIKFYPKKYGFDKIMGEVMGYVPDESNMKSLLPMILAGYFSKSIFSKKQEN